MESTAAGEAESNVEVHVVGGDPVHDAVATALADVDIDVVESDVAALEDARFAVVTDVAGADTFERANRAARAGNTSWIAVEVGGMGGRPFSDVDAAITGFSPQSGCYECLRARVASTAVDDETDAGERPSANRSAVRLAGAIAGHECITLFAGERRQSIVGHVLEVPRSHDRRRCLPVPGCSCQTTDRDRTVGRDDDTLALEVAVERAETAIDDRVGIVSGLGEVESFPAPYYLATTADTTQFSDARAPRQAAGVDDDWNAAMMKAVGESLERYCAGVYRDGDFVHASLEELDRAVTPTDLVRPADAPAFDPTAEHRWVVGENLETGDRTHLPAAAVQFPQPGDRLVPSITTGLGLGSSTIDALLSGLTEVVERDATMLSWYSTFEPLGLSVDDDTFELLARRARGEGLTVTPLLVTQDVDVPVVAVAVHRDGETDHESASEATDPDDWPAFAIGSAAALDATAAARSALAESIQNWMELRSIGPDEAAEASGAIGEYASFPDSVRNLVDVDETIPAETVGPDSVPTGEAALESLCERIVDVGLTPYAARLTTRDVETLGFEAVRVVVPGTQPLFTDEAFFGDRARTVPTDLGFEPRLERAFHPYP